MPITGRGDYPFVSEWDVYVGKHQHIYYTSVSGTEPGLTAPLNDWFFDSVAGGVKNAIMTVDGSASITLAWQKIKQTALILAGIGMTIITAVLKKFSTLTASGTAVAIINAVKYKVINPVLSGLGVISIVTEKIGGAGASAYIVILRTVQSSSRTVR